MKIPPEDLAATEVAAAAAISEPEVKRSSFSAAAAEPWKLL